MRSFEAALRSLRDRVIAQIVDADSVEDVVHMAQRRAIPRDGTLEDGTRYSVHGIGCWMADTRGREADVDIDEKGPRDLRRLAHFHALGNCFRRRRQSGRHSRGMPPSR
ncbi:DUF6896 domain-containing protein [Nonomuraea salmonea]|uniref:DUF6896 domain-containing protein n=1 Tax=Nonomuraea salmonea TaxID=46181 RepID=UPI003CD098DB